MGDGHGQEDLTGDVASSRLAVRLFGVVSCLSGFVHVFRRTGSTLLRRPRTVLGIEYRWPAVTRPTAIAGFPGWRLVVSQFSRVAAYASMASRWYAARPGTTASYAARHVSLSTTERPMAR